jgi:hypothetical protein
VLAQVPDGLAAVPPDLERAERPERELHGHGQPEPVQRVGGGATGRDLVEDDADQGHRGQ